MGLFSETKRSLGLDVGTASVKLVQLAMEGGRLKLETYGEVWVMPRGSGTGASNFSLPNEEIGAIVSELVKATKAKPTNVTAAIPIFSSFVTIFELPALSETELADAIPYQARKYVPVPIEDVTLDWSIASRGKRGENQSEVLEILLVAIPNEVIARYLKIAQIAGLDLKALESESFAVARGLTGGDKNPLCLIDIGASSTDITIVDEGTVRVSHNFDIGGHRFNNVVASTPQAEATQRGQNIKPAGIGKIPPAALPLIDTIVNEINRFVTDYTTKTNRKITKIILSGGKAQMPGLSDYFVQKFAIPVLFANPFGNLIYPSVLDKKLKSLGPSYAVAVGAAMRHFSS